MSTVGLTNKYDLTENLGLQSIEPFIHQKDFCLFCTGHTLFSNFFLLFSKLHPYTENLFVKKVLRQQMHYNDFVLIILLFNMRQAVFPYNHHLMTRRILKAIIIESVIACSSDDAII